MAKLVLEPDANCDHFPGKNAGDLNELADRCRREIEENDKILTMIEATRRYRETPPASVNVTPCEDCEKNDKCVPYSQLKDCKTPSAALRCITIVNVGSKLELIGARRGWDGIIRVTLNEPYPPCFKRKPYEPQVVADSESGPPDPSYAHRHRFDKEPKAKIRHEVT